MSLQAYNYVWLIWPSTCDFKFEFWPSEQLHQPWSFFFRVLNSKWNARNEKIPSSVKNPRTRSEMDFQITEQVYQDLISASRLVVWRCCFNLPIATDIVWKQLKFKIRNVYLLVELKSSTYIDSLTCERSLKCSVALAILAIGLNAWSEHRGYGYNLPHLHTRKILETLLLRLNVL